MLPKIPLANWVNDIVNWLEKVLGPVLNAISNFIHMIVMNLTTWVSDVPWWLIIIIVAAIAYLAGRWKLALGTIIGLLLIYDLQLWDQMISTLVLVLLSSILAVAIGIPLGIWAARRRGVYTVMSPVLDLMQTMPPFVYLVPVLIFFNIGVVPSIIATVVFSMPPAVRLTRLGLLQVPEDLVEAARAFGTRDRQLLWKVQIPLAMPSIMAGVNQTLMLALSMVVIAAMIGAGGLGQIVVDALESINVGQGAEAGLAIVIIAIILDRISQRIGQRKHVN
jgi:glycine betaine/proline transport system permease protein